MRIEGRKQQTKERNLRDGKEVLWQRKIRCDGDKPDDH